MYATGAIAKIAAILIFVPPMVCSLGNRGFQFISTATRFSTGQAGQHQQVQTEYEQYLFHPAKIMVLKTQRFINSDYYHNKVASSLPNLVEPGIHHLYHGQV